MDSRPFADMPTLSLPDERLCQEFQSRWRAISDGETGIRPSLESALGNASSGGQSDVLLHLLLIEVTARIRMDDDPGREEYLARFPTHAESIAGVFDRASMTGPGVLGPSATMPASEFPGYEVIGVLGQGGMGIVCAAREIATGRTVAIKQVRPDQTEPERLSRFRREAEVMQQLGHRHIVPLLAVGGDPAQPFLVMEMVKGGSLEDRREQKWTPRQAAEFVAKLADALGSVHDKGIIHRDLKPANILLDEQGEPMISDFGLARLLDVEARMTASGAQMGTPAFMAPEQARGEIALIGPPTDVHALGLILYEMLTGQRPFDAGTVPAALKKVEETDPTPPRTIDASVPRDLETICLHCLHKDPKRRYQTAAALMKDLRSFLANRKIDARPIGLSEKAVKWSRRHQVIAALSIAAVCLLGVAAVASWLYYDHYHRPKTALFANFVNRRGVPEGRGPLTPEQSNRRWSSYRITSRAGRVEQVEIIDGRGRLNAESSHHAVLERDRTTSGKVCRYEYTRKANGEIDEERGYDRDGNLLWALHFTSPTNAHYRNAKGYPRARTGSGAAYLEFDWDERGYEREIHYRDRSGNPHPNDEGVYGVRRELDGSGFMVRETFLDSKDQPAHNRKSRYTSAVYVRDEAGNILDQKFLGLDDKPVVSSDGFYRQVNEYDAHGNGFARTYFDADGRPAYSKPYAVHRSEYAFDERGFFVEARLLDADGKLTVTSEGYARMTVRRDEQGNGIEHAYFGPDGKPASRKGYSRETGERDERGRVIAWRCWDGAGKPTLTEGHHLWTLKYDEKGRVLEEAFFDEQDKPTLATAGYARLEKTYDELGNLTEERYFGTDGKPIAVKAGYAGLRFRYDDRSNRIETRYVDGDGKAVFGDKGYARVQRAFDDNGKEKEAEYFGPDDQPVIESRLGIHRTTSVHDARGNPIEATTYGIDRQPMVTKKGFARMRMRYDARDLLSEFACFDAADKPTAGSDGVARQTFVNNDAGETVEARCYGPDGKPVLHALGGFHHITSRYDARGKQIAGAAFGTDGKPAWSPKFGFSSMTSVIRYGPLTEDDTAIFDQEGKPALTAQGVHRVVRVTDARDRIVEERNYGLDGKPILSKHGYARTTLRYDSRGNLIEQLTFGLDDKPILTRDGLARMVKRYDERGNAIEAASFGIRGEPVCDNEKRIHRREAKYDALNRLLEVRYFGMDGRPAVAVQGYAKIVYKRDERGNVVEEAHFGLDDKLILIAGGYAVDKRSYDERGNETSVRFFDKEGRPAIALEIGAHELRREYDAQGRLVEDAYFGPDGTPVLSTKHYASVQRKYDAFGNTIEESYFDVAKKRLRTVKKRFDPLGNWIESAGFTPEGEPSDGEFKGIWKQTNKYDVRGNATESAVFDVAGKPTHDSDGVHRTVRTYNNRNQRIRAAFFGRDGKPCLAKGGFSIMEGRYDARGHLREMEWFGTDGKPTGVLDSKASKLVTRPDEQDRSVLEEHFGIDGKPVLGPEGAFRTTYLYNPRGHTDEVRFFGIDGKPASNAEGYATLKLVFAEDMRSTSRAFFDAAGLPVVMSKGYARMTQKLDEIGRVIDERYFGADGKPIAVGGFARVTKGYNAHGKVVAEAWFDANDKPVAGKDGYASYKSETDELGRVLRHSYFGTDGKPTPNQHGVCSWTATYNNQNVRIGERFFGPDGKPCLSKRGIAGYDYVLDTKGKKVEEILYALDGKPFLKARVDDRGRMVERHVYRNATRPVTPTDSTRFAPIVRSKFDSRGREIETAYFDVQMKPMLHPGGFFRVTSELKEEDAEGVVREEKYFGPDGERVVHKEGGAYRAEKRYTFKGALVGVAMFGKDDKPVANPDGWASWRSKMDERGLQVEYAQFGKDGKPILHKDGYARTTSKYDAKGRRTEARFFGIDDKPALNKFGIAGFRTKYDSAGLIVEETSFGVDDRPIVARQTGYARSTSKYDERGNEIERALFGADDAPIDGSDGYARRVQKFDADGKFVALALFGADGKPRQAQVVLTEVVPEGVGTKLGLKVGDVLAKYDGQDIRSMHQFFALRAKHPDAKTTHPLIVERGGETIRVDTPGGLLGIRMNVRAKPVTKDKGEEKES